MSGRERQRKRERERERESERRRDMQGGVYGVCGETKCNDFKMHPRSGPPPPPFG